MAAKVAGPVSPLAPPGGFPDLPAIGGVEYASGAAGVRYPGRTDVTLIRLAPGSVVAGVLTRSATRSAPVLDCEAKLGGASDAGAAILVNSGNSNAFTGRGGVASVRAITDAVARVAGVPEARVFTASTGVIGEPLPHDRITAKLADLAAALAPDGIAGAARAIMTTDTFPKGAARSVTVDGREVRIAGIAKGSGMIAPDMATMLVYLFTDAAIPYEPAAGDAARDHRPHLQLHHRRRRHLDLRHAADRRDRRLRRRRRPATRASPRRWRR